MSQIAEDLYELSPHIRIRDVFNAHCGDGARYISSEIGQRDGWDVVILTFETVPEGRRFRLDGVIREPGSSWERDVNAAVLKIADIAKNVRQHIAAD